MREMFAVEGLSKAYFMREVVASASPVLREED
jgi:hypothetical protein